MPIGGPRKTRFDRGTLRRPCLRYIHFMGLYDPLNTDPEELLSVLAGAGSDVVDQCAIDVAEGLKDIAAHRGTKVSAVKKEFREFLRELPTADQIDNLGIKRARDVIASAHRKARREMWDRGERVAGTFGALPVIKLKPTKRHALRFQIGRGGHHVYVRTHAVKRMKQRQVSAEEIAEVLGQYDPVYYKNARRFGTGDVIVVAKPHRTGWIVITVMRRSLAS